MSVLSLAVLCAAQLTVIWRKYQRVFSGESPVKEAEAVSVNDDPAIPSDRLGGYVLWARLSLPSAQAIYHMTAKKRSLHRHDNPTLNGRLEMFKGGCHCFLVTSHSR